MKTSEQLAAFILFQCLKIQASAKIISKGNSFYLISFIRNIFQSYVTVTSSKSSNGLYLLSKLRIFTHSQNKGNIKSLALTFRGEDHKLPTPWGQKNCRLGHMNPCPGHPLPHCLPACCPESCFFCTCNNHNSCS